MELKGKNRSPKKLATRYLVVVHSHFVKSCYFLALQLVVEQGLDTHFACLIQLRVSLFLTTHAQVGQQVSPSVRPYGYLFVILLRKIAHLMRGFLDTGTRL